jgi:fermentation-respiration switch protein FrsA (DUF1100 family)
MDNVRRGLRRVLTTLVVVAVVWVAVLAVYLWKNQERVVFQPPGATPDAPRPARRVTYRAADGVELFGFVLDAPAGAVRPAPVVIAFHGNADLAAWTAPWAHELATRAGVSVLIPELRGYGGIPGNPTYETAAIDSRAALDYARTELGAPSIVVYGHSLGSAIGAELAAHMEEAGRAPRALVLQSPFSSARDMATRMLLPPIPGLWGWISRVHYDTRARVASLDAPVFVSHGTRDLNIPVRMGRDVHAAAKRQGELLIVEGAGHNDVGDLGGERYWRWLVSAVQSPSGERR